MFISAKIKPAQRQHERERSDQPDFIGNLVSSSNLTSGIDEAGRDSSDPKTSSVTSYLHLRGWKKEEIQHPPPRPQLIAEHLSASG